ncbi:MAG: triphosphoribosyl-dephospho-CoA synthase CitG [Clostridiales bacterium]|nr:triphosphoribosyl-dephospho-CoA synthase CitG [Clostridiales bacterium]
MIDKNRYGISMDIGSIAVKSMLYEISCFPSPGLVSPISSGAHDDMDYYTFIDSTMALNKYFPLFVQEGLTSRDCKKIFNSIRQIGIEAEKEMFKATNGVNTHKGMLFLMGISCGAVGKAIYEKRPFHHIQDIIKAMTKGIVEKELTKLNKDSNLSNGERIYLKYNSTGIRGEVEAGIPIVFNYSLDFYNANKKLPINHRLVHTLIGIMQYCDDTTILHRHSYETLEEVRKKAKEIIKLGGMTTEIGRQKIKNLNEEFIKKNISPGGSADLLGITVFLDFVFEYMKNLDL